MPMANAWCLMPETVNIIYYIVQKQKAGAAFNLNTFMRACKQDAELGMVRRVKRNGLISKVARVRIVRLTSTEERLKKGSFP